MKTPFSFFPSFGSRQVLVSTRPSTPPGRLGKRDFRGQCHPETSRVGVPWDASQEWWLRACDPSLASLDPLYRTRVGSVPIRAATLNFPPAKVEPTSVR